MNRLDSGAFTLLGRHIKWSDVIGNVIGLIALALGWLLVDVVGVPLGFAGGFAFCGFVYVIYGALVLRGMREWWLRSRGAEQPALEGAPA